MWVLGEAHGGGSCSRCMGWISIPCQTHDDVQVTAAAAEKSRQERQGLDFDRVPDADLFFVDKVTPGMSRGALGLGTED